MAQTNISMGTSPKYKTRPGRECPGMSTPGNYYRSGGYNRRTHWMGGDVDLEWEGVRDAKLPHSSISEIIFYLIFEKSDLDSRN